MKHIRINLFFANRLCHIDRIKQIYLGILEQIIHIPR